MESNSLKCSSIDMVHSIDLKFGMYIIGHRPTHCVEFGEFRINSFFTGAQKRILIHSQVAQRYCSTLAEHCRTTACIGSSWPFFNNFGQYWHKNIKNSAKTDSFLLPICFFFKMIGDF